MSSTIKRQYVTLRNVRGKDEFKKLKKYLDEHGYDYGIVDADPYGLSDEWVHDFDIHPTWNLMRDLREDLDKMGINIIPVVETYEVMFGMGYSNSELIESYELK